MSSVMVALCLLLLNLSFRPVDIAYVNMCTVRALCAVHVKAHHI